MKNSPPIRSRRVLFKLGTISLITITAGLGTGCEFFDDEKLKVQKRLIRSLNHLERAQEIGNAFRSLDNTPVFSSVDHLTEVLLQWLNLDSQEIKKLSDEKLISHLNQQIQDDFINENIVIIDTWMFSKTEVMLCALADFLPSVKLHKT